MQATHIRQLEKCYQDLKADDYVVDMKTRTSHNSLLFLVKLKDGDEAQILEARRLWCRVPNRANARLLGFMA